MYNTIKKTFLITFAILSIRIAAQNNINKDILFKNVIEHVISNISINKFDNAYFKVIRYPKFIEWQKTIIHPLIEIYSPSKEAIKSDFRKTNLEDLFQSYLKENGWTIEYKGSDHWGESAYRIRVNATKENKHFDYIFVSNQIGNRDWDNHLYFLIPEKTKVENSESFDDFFKRIIQWIEKRDANLIHKTELFDVSFSPNKIPVVWEEDEYNELISFTCRFGPQSTKSGTLCFGNMPTMFIGFLINNGFVVKKKKDYSVKGWERVVYNAAKLNKSFDFLFEAERSRSIGFAKITIIKN